MISNTLSTIHNCTITPSTTIIIKISMVNAIIPSLILNMSINCCKTVVTTVTITAVVTITMVAINIITIIITSARAIFL